MNSDPASGAVPRTGAAIVAQELLKEFGEGASRTVAVSGASLEVAWGEMLFLVGPSGSGKTTLLSMISGILRPTSGHVLVGGTDIWSLGKDALAAFRLASIGFVFQDYHLFPRLTTVENVAIPLILRGLAWAEALRQAQRFLEIVGLATRMDMAPVQLSGGEQQRVAIARAMVSEPEMMILDEPTASLDGDTGRRIVEFVRTSGLGPQRCVLIVTHDARIYEYADRVLRMEDGRIVGVEKGSR